MEVRRMLEEAERALAQELERAARDGMGAERIEASVVVCSRNRHGLLRDFVDSVLAGDHVPAEIVIVDQSTGPDPALALHRTERGCAIRYLWRPAPGASRARNLGAAEAAHDVLVFADDDMLAPPGWLAALVRGLEVAGPGAVVSGRVVDDAPAAGKAFAPSLSPSEQPAIYEGRIPRDVLYSGNMAIRRSTLVALGGFDERLGPGTRVPAAEDNDLGYRALAAGLQIVYRPDATLVHRAWRGPGERVPLRWRYGRGQGAFYAKHLRDADGFMRERLAATLRERLGLMSRQLVRNPRHAVQTAAFIAGLGAGLAEWLVRRPRGK